MSTSGMHAGPDGKIDPFQALAFSEHPRKSTKTILVKITRWLHLTVAVLALGWATGRGSTVAEHTRAIVLIARPRRSL